MKNTDEDRDVLPDSFESEEKAADFWDNHSLTEFEDSLEPVEVGVDIQRRHFEIEVDEECFNALRDKGRVEKKSAGQVANQILKNQLSA